MPRVTAVEGIGTIRFPLSRKIPAKSDYRFSGMESLELTSHSRLHTDAYVPRACALPR
jgi:hypothetical protein